jgi:hypothetical protein
LIQIVARYETDPVFNDWHKVTVTQENSHYRWENDAGVSCIMKPLFDEWRFELENDCPYYNSCKEVIIFPKFEKGKISQNFQIDFLSFNGDRYLK